MRHLVPALELGGVFQTKVCRQVNDARTSRQQLGRLRHGHAMRRRKEHHIATSEWGLRGFTEGKRNASAQRRKHVGHRHAVFLARGDGVQFNLRMLRKQSQQLHTGIAGAANDPNLDHARVSES